MDYKCRFKIDKSVKLMNMVELNLYMTVENLLNRKISTQFIPVQVYQIMMVGLQLKQEKLGVKTMAQRRQLYNYLQNSPSNYSAPRVVRLGLQLNY